MNKLIIILLLFTATTNTAKAQAVKHTPITLGITDELTSSHLSEKRKLNIYLPEGYDASDTTRYPVIYLLDGGLDEDFIHIVGLVQFNTFPWINRLPKSIIVGIVNTDRKRDFTFPTTAKSDKQLLPTSGGSEKFISFLEDELQPYIQKHYKTNSSKSIIGESLGGLLATEILFKKPYLFNKYIIISPSLWWDNGSILNKPTVLSAAQLADNISIYLAVGKEGLALSTEPHVMEVDANLLAEKIKAAQNKHINLIFDYLPDENHATIAHQAVLNAFKKLSELK
ncbi:MAG: alpha/beta hydrolase [Bacteroidetes bacterium]|nr:alpha/beta hydrolase [Bacteroidota bacterium]